MTPEDRNHYRETARQMGRDLNDPHAELRALEFFEATDRILNRLRSLPASAITPKGFIKAIDDAQAACQDFMAASQAFAATLALWGKPRNPPQ